MNAPGPATDPAASARAPLHGPILAGILSALAMAACYFATGPTLGLFFGGFFVAAFLTPMAALSPRPTLGVCTLVCVISLAWSIALLKTDDTLGQLAQLVLVLMSFSFALGTTSVLFKSLRLSASAANAIVIVISLAWLTWPVWLSPELPSISPRLVQMLVNVHPPLVANGVLVNEPPWTEQTWAYQLTNLNQDVAINLPGNAIACIGANLVLSGCLFGLATICRNTNKSAEA